MNKAASGILKREWVQREYDNEKAAVLSSELNLPHSIVKLLLARGISETSDIKEFLNPKIREMYNPFLFSDMESAVNRIRKAVDSSEKILIYGDRDMDGITSVAIMVSTLKTLGADLCFHLNREDGYGISRKILKEYVEKGVKLVVTVDCGITANEEINELAGLGIDVVVTDHHQSQGALPGALAVIDPHIIGSGYPFKDLAGCGVSFKVMQALMFSFAKDFGKNAVLAGIHEGRVKACRARNASAISDELVLEENDAALRMLESADFFVFLDIVRYEKSKEMLPEIFKKYICGKELVFLSERFPVGKLITEADMDSLPVKDLLGLYYYGEFYYDLRMRHFVYQSLDIAALGTMADLVSLKGENRTIVNAGVKLLEKTRNAGLKKLFCDMNMNLQECVLGSKELSWRVIPLLNSCGRCARPETALELLLCGSEEKAGGYVEKIYDLNNERKSLQEKNRKIFEISLEKEYKPEDDFIFLSAENIDHGVTGIVANHFLKKFRKPVFLMINQKGSIHGASRSPAGIPVLPMLEGCSDILQSYGGHPCAAGFRIDPANLGVFKERLKHLFEAGKSGPSRLAEILIDAECVPHELTEEFVEYLKLLEPFGSGNSEPVFLMRGVRVRSAEKIGPDKNHIKFTLDLGGRSVNALGWDFAEYADGIRSGCECDVVFCIEGDNYGKNKTFRLILSDMALCSSDEPVLASSK